MLLALLAALILLWRMERRADSCISGSSSSSSWSCKARCGDGGPSVGLLHLSIPKSPSLPLTPGGLGMCEGRERMRGAVKRLAKCCCIRTLGLCVWHVCTSLPPLLLLLLLLWVTSRGGEKVEVCGRGCWCWCADCGCSAEGLFVVSSGVVWADVSEERAVRMEGDGERGLARRAGGSGEGTAAAACRARASRCRRCRYC
mmetsp:Transcript_25535/g.65734  ORF Transcript_25535/g.65734 Transcript_25535/m.65734 type:complete len:200 (+) Transcript_25535:419-1018(+)